VDLHVWQHASISEAYSYTHIPAVQIQIQIVYSVQNIIHKTVYGMVMVYVYGMVMVCMYGMVMVCMYGMVMVYVYGMVMVCGKKHE